MTMPWGKYVGEPLEDIPAGYLAWALFEARLPNRLCDAIRSELLGRLDGVAREDVPCPASRAQLPDDPEVTAALREIIARGYRAAAMKAHPDRGGSHDAMIATGQAHAWLEALVR